MASREYAGHWWVAGNTEDKQPGTLKLELGKWPRLTLIGGFELRALRQLGGSENRLAVTDEERRLPAVHGVSLGQKITLLDCRSVHANYPMTLGEPPQFQILEASQALIGLYIDASDAAVFDTCRLRVENQHNLMQAGDISIITREQSTNEYSVRLDTIGSSQIEVEDFTISMKPWSDINSSSTRRSRYARSEVGVEIEISSNVPRSYEAFGKLRNDLIDLTALASDKRCGIVSEHVQLAEKERFIVPDIGTDGKISQKELERTVTAEVHTVRTVLPDSSETPVDSDDLLFTVGDMPFDKMFSRWLPLRRKIDIAGNMIFGLLNREPAFVQTQLLTIAVAAEALSRGLRPDALPMTPRDFERLLGEALKTLDPGDRERFEGLVRNEPTYRDRLLDIASIPAQAAVDLVLPNREGWVNSLRSVRNGLAHGLARDMGELDELHLLFLRTKYLLYLVIMAEIGLSESVQERCIRKNASLMRLNRAARNAAAT
jgi:hypothetical protein